MDQMKTPGPDHPITLTAAERRMQALYQGHVIADGADVIVLKEANYHPVCYFRREDIAMEFLAPTARDTYCPYKGHAHYFSLMMDGRLAEDASWTYEDPYPAMEAIRGRLAFFSHHVQVQPVGAAATDDGIAATIRHTDEGDGRSQSERWPATASKPGT